MTKYLSVLLLGAVIFTFPAHAASPDLSPQTAHSEGDVDANKHDLVQGSHVEGHIAFLKAEIGISAAQEAEWQPVAAAMREDVRNLNDAEHRIARQQGSDTALDYLQNRVLFANLRAQGEQRFLTAFQPLYGVLSSQQKRVADELLIPAAPQ